MWILTRELFSEKGRFFVTYLLIDAATAVPLLTINDERYQSSTQEQILDVSTWLIKELQRFSQTEHAPKIQGVIVGNGPGSYTGLRIAMALAKTWCYARNLPLCGVSSLYALAPQPETASDLIARGLTNIATLIDARAGGVYMALGELRELTGEAPKVHWSCPKRLNWEQLAQSSKALDAVFCVAGNLREKWEVAGLKSVHWNITQPKFAGLEGAVDQHGIWGTRRDNYQTVTLEYLRGARPLGVTSPIET